MSRVDKKSNKEFLYVSKNDASMITWYGTGHAAFKKQLFNLKISSEDSCWLCKDNKETSASNRHHYNLI